MKRIASLLAVTLLSACSVTVPGGAPPESPPATSLPRGAPPESPPATSLPRATAPATALMAKVARAAPVEASVDQTVDGLLAFGHELHERAAEPSTNTVISPFSIALAFGMARAGAAGDTADLADHLAAFLAGR